ncbi:glycoside hydrolase family 15 protein [Streptomyces sp. ST2-7A]|uniref:glycoside hydrolase family 15 protein n=1 Tax=Streptomyces sp. ST2-7A TaxID=2907214 RepID=UPI001F443221|nr:glycoside hydrolase family 15 protein [Streptomyces sp. ST2-7A]MCE7081666.1 glycoside hydrolase family 15 protein [Streptomyces sp. ST2-7A]
MSGNRAPRATPATTPHPAGGEHGGYPPIDSHAFLSDCHTAALVGPDGAIEWLCSPRFDGPSVFARILDRKRGGAWELTVEGAEPPVRRYLGDTLVLESRRHGPEGEAVVRDLLAVHPDSPDSDAPVAGKEGTAGGPAGFSAVGVLVREVRCVSGRVRVLSRVEARPDYGRHAARWEAYENVLRCALDTGTEGLWLGGDTPHTVDGDGIARAAVDLEEGESTTFLLGYRGEPLTGPGRTADGGRMAEETAAAWQSWSDRTSYDGPAADLVRRGGVVLRGLLSDETGGLLAAPTTSLPEWIGGTRNWDYRYVWHRDAALVVLVLLRLGHEEEAERYLRFALNGCVDRSERMEPMLKLDGTTRIEESELDHLEGYARSGPVRVGNEAYEQHQMDSYGHLLDAAYSFQQVTGRLTDRDLAELWRLTDILAGIWREPDHGLWEARGEPRHWTYSRLYSWVALDRGVRLAELCGETGVPVDRWRSERDAVRADLLEHGWNEEVGAFVQAYGERGMDAALLHLSLQGFIDGDDPRMVSTIDRIAEELGDGDHLVHRYDHKVTEDGFEEPEGAFLMCSFDMVSALVPAGRIEEARRRFDALCARTGSFGLYSEQMAGDGTFLGNYPQAFTHLALIEAAMNLEAAEHREALHSWAERRGEERLEREKRETSGRTSAEGGAGSAS